MLCKGPRDLILTQHWVTHSHCCSFRFTIMYPVSFSSLLHYSLELLEMIHPECPQGWPFLIFLSQLKCHLLKRPFPDNVISTSLFSSSFLNALQRIYHFIVLVVNFFVCLSVYSLSLNVSKLLERRTLDHHHAAFSAISTAQSWSSSN